MGYCYLCEAVWLGYTTSESFCGECRKLQNIVKVFGIRKTLNCVKIKIEKSDSSTQTIDLPQFPPYKLI